MPGGAPGTVSMVDQDGCKYVRGGISVLLPLRLADLQLTLWVRSLVVYICLRAVARNKACAFTGHLLVMDLRRLQAGPTSGCFLLGLEF